MSGLTQVQQMQGKLVFYRDILWLIYSQNIYSISLETVTDPRLHISALAVILPSVPSIKSMSVPDYLRTSAVIIQAGV